MSEKLTIDKDLQTFLTPLSDEQKKGLREQIKKEGCRDDIVVWKTGNDKVVVDGHNRLEICKDEKVDFNVREMEFPDKMAVMEWMLTNQSNRRNLTDEQHRYCLGLIYNRRRDASHAEAQESKTRATKRQKGQETLEFGDKAPDGTEAQDQGTPDAQANGEAKPAKKKKRGRSQRGRNVVEEVAREEQTSTSSVKRSARFVEAVEAIAGEYPQLKVKIVGGRLKITTKQAEELAKIGKRDQKKVVNECLKDDVKTYRQAYDAIFKRDVPPSGEEESPSKPLVYDSMGNEITDDRLIDVFKLNEEIDQSIKDAKALRTKLNKIAEKPGSEKIRLEGKSIRSTFSDLIKILDARKPYTVCPKCDGLGKVKQKGKKVKCEVCDGDGYLDSVTYDVYLKDQSDT